MNRFNIVYKIQDIWEQLYEADRKILPEYALIWGWNHWVGNDAVFLILQKELYYRHIHAKVGAEVWILLQLQQSLQLHS